MDNSNTHRVAIFAETADIRNVDNDIFRCRTRADRLIATGLRRLHRLTRAAVGGISNQASEPIIPFQSPEVNNV